LLFGLAEKAITYPCKGNHFGFDLAGEKRKERKEAFANMPVCPENV